MDTKVKSASNANTTQNNRTSNSAINNMRSNVPGKDKNDDNKNQSTAESPQTATAAGAEDKTNGALGATQQPAGAAQPSQAEAVATAEPSKKDIKASLQEQNARGLEDTVKLVEQLGKKISQKNKLSNTISNLDSFIVTQSDDKDDMAADSKFPRCELVISDDGGEEFVTKNPFIISKVVDMVKQLCIDKLAEVEATIIIP